MVFVRQWSRDVAVAGGHVVSEAVLGVLVASPRPSGALDVMKGPQQPWTGSSQSREGPGQVPPGALQCVPFAAWREHFIRSHVIPCARRCLAWRSVVWRGVVWRGVAWRGVVVVASVRRDGAGRRRAGVSSAISSRLPNRRSH